MLITSLGHAAVSVITSELHLLVDPVLTDRFMGGIAAAQPDRVVDVAGLPPPDIVVVTHFHAGHLEPDTLALLDRDTQLFVPDDSTVRTVVDRLGFRRVTTVAPGQRLSADRVELTFTGTGQGFPYVGVLVAAPDGTFWYMGDRGDTLPTDQIDEVVAGAGGVDVLVASHPSDFHSFLLHSTWDGGAEEGESHPAWVARTLETVIRVGPKLVLPQTTSYRYVDSASWLNRYLFPMRPDEFGPLVRAVAPGIGTDFLRPGDAVQLTGRTPAVHRDAAPFVRRLDGAEPRGLDPTLPPPAVRDADPEGLGDDELVRRVQEYLTGSLLPWLDAGGAGTYRELVRSFRALGAGYRLSCVLPSGRVAVFRIAVDDGWFTVERQDEAPPRYGEPHTRIPASTLDRWVRDVIPYFVAAVDCRRTGQLFDVAASRAGNVSVRPVDTRCLVSAHLMADRQRLNRWLAGEVDRLLAADREQLVDGRVP